MPISVTADIVVFSEKDANQPPTHVLLVRRKHDPFEDHWALPGGFVNEGERLEDAALRELKEETGLSVPKAWQVGAWGDPDRDPRGHVVTIAHVAGVQGQPEVIGADDAADAQWVDLALARTSRNNPLAFDHHAIIERALIVYWGST